MSRILCVEDEPSLLRTLGANLRARGHEVELVADGHAALEAAASVRPDLVILDLGLPGLSGMEVIRRLRGWTSTPIIILSARDEEFDKVGALDAGADDYVSKPFDMGELMARVRAALRRSTTADETPAVSTEHFLVDLAAKRVIGVSGEIRLTPTEWAIVEYLVRRDGTLVTAVELLRAVWGPEYGTETNYLRVHLAHIRRKLEPEAGRTRYFLTEPGLGYRFRSVSER
ncbi:MAG: two-component response regulator [Actinomycetota bacterium]|jgi:two-component system KDP operon response regulator KdpE